MTLTRALAAVALVVTLTACGSDEPDLAACEEAMRGQLAAALESGEEGSRPSECEGVSDAELQEIAGRLIGEELGG